MRWKDAKYQNHLEIQMDGLFHDATLRPLRFYNFDTVGPWTHFNLFSNYKKDQKSALQPIFRDC